jgi:hypothetical protein
VAGGPEQNREQRDFVLRDKAFLIPRDPGIGKAVIMRRCNQHSATDTTSIGRRRHESFRLYAFVQLLDRVAGDGFNRSADEVAPCDPFEHASWHCG